MNVDLKVLIAMGAALSILGFAAGSAFGRRLMRAAIAAVRAARGAFRNPTDLPPVTPARKKRSPRA